MQLNETNIDKINSYKLYVARNASCRYANITEKKLRCFICLNHGRNIYNCLKKNWCYLCKGLNNLAICNNRDIKETPENTNVNFLLPK